MSTQSPVIRMSKMYKDRYINLGTYFVRQEEFDAKLESALGGLNASTEFAHKVYRLAREMCPDYQGGIWIFAELKNNDGFFIYPFSMDDILYEIEDETNGYIQIDGYLFGLILTLIALDECSCRHQSEDELAQMFFAKKQMLAEQIVAVTNTVLEDKYLSDKDKTRETVMSGFLESYLD